MILFYFPNLRFIRFGLATLALFSTCLTAWWWQHFLVVPAAHSVPAGLVVVVPALAVAERLPCDGLRFCAIRAGCAVRGSGSRMVVRGRGEAIIRAVWLCDLYEIPLSSYILTPEVVTGQFSWQVTL